jgi:membrane associated rhomboid family serine protease
MKLDMKSKIKNWIFNSLTPAVKLVILVNLGVSILFYLLEILTGFDPRDLFSAYPTYSNHFHVYQLLTFMFVHSTNPAHVFFNVLFLIIFSPSVEKKFGFRNFLIIYMVCAWIGYMFINNSYALNKEIVEKRIISSGLNPENIPLNKRNEVKEDFFNKLNSKQKIAVKDYNYITSKTSGASGALYGIVLVYILINFFNYRKILFLALAFYFVYQNFENFLEPNNLINGSSVAHFGGMMGGLIIGISLLIKNKKMKRINLENEKLS